jgi:hypothetical protein
MDNVGVKDIASTWLIDLSLICIVYTNFYDVLKTYGYNRKITTESIRYVKFLSTYNYVYDRTSKNISFIVS